MSVCEVRPEHVRYKDLSELSHNAHVYSMSVGRNDCINGGVKVT